MLMGVAERVAGPRAVFAVVPMLAALAVWLTFLVGRRLAGPAAGVMAALLLVSSPAFLVGALRPMSDLPAATWWTLALLAATGGGGAWAAVAGAATSLAILTRPNLAPLAVVMAAPLLIDAWQARNAKSKDLTPRCAVFAITAAVGPLVVALINWHLYGSPLESGYGRLEGLFAADRVGANLSRYTTWLLQTHTPVILVALVAPLLLKPWGQVFTFSVSAGRWHGRRFAWLCLALVLATVALYLPYLEFEDWTYLRFLLPAYPALLALVAAALVALASRLTRRWAWLGLTVIAAGLATFGWTQASRQGVFGWAAAEQRYVTMGRLIDASLPREAVILAMQHSGSARYYSGRLTLRYDLIEPAALDPTLTGLLAAGVHPYLLLESWEEDRFREQFAGTSAWGALDWPAMAEATTSTTVRLYDLRDRPQ